MDIIKTLTDWPVIVQGTIGSALFWIILEFGQLSFRKIAARLQKDRSTANFFALAAHELEDEVSEGEVKDIGRFFCLYWSLHYLLKAMIVTVISLAVENWVQIFAIVGYLIAIYFLFRALSFVPHSDSLGTDEEREKKFEDIIKQHKSKS